MPGVYAHDSFGVIVREKMNNELSSIARKYNSAYRVGLQGPDIFFFYRTICLNRIQRYGSHLHRADGAPFFRHALEVLHKYGRDSSQYAYLLGFICHFSLDGKCHPYINKQVDKIGVAHLEIEAEFEKTLLRSDGLDPIGFSTGNLIYTDAGTAAAAKPFFPSMSKRVIHETLIEMRLVRKFFTAPHPFKANVINGAMKILGVYHIGNGLMNQRKDNPACIETSKKLTVLFDEAVPDALTLQEQFDDCLKTGKKLPATFHHSFE